MKTNLFILFNLICKLSFSQLTTTFDSLYYSNNLLLYKKDSVPFSGLAVDFYENKCKRVEVTYLNGKTYGYSKTYYENGNLKSVVFYYENSVEQGPYSEWFDNGIQKIKGNYNFGEKDGCWFRYDKDGKLIYEGEYIDGEKNGEWKYFDNDGELLRDEVYKKGKLMDSKVFKEIQLIEYPASQDKK